MNAQVGKELGKGEGFVLELQTADWTGKERLGVAALRPGGILSARPCLGRSEF